MNINTVLPTITSFSALLPITEQAEVKISFWGCRSVHINGYEGSLSVDALAERVFGILRERSNFSDIEIADGKVLETRITRLFDQEWEVTKQSNFLTITFAVIGWVASGVFDLFSSAFSVFFYGKYPYSTQYAWDGEMGIGPITRLSMQNAASRT